MARYKEGEGKANGNGNGKIIIISEWAGLGLDEAPQKAENREEWRKVVARSHLMPQRSFRQRGKVSE